MNVAESTSTRPYLIRALYEWCTDNGFTPYVAVAVDDSVQVPREYVKNNEIVLNISFDATSSLKLGNDFIEFKARFAGSAREIMVPITHVIAIYARENGQGMAFPMLPPGAVQGPGTVDGAAIGSAPETSAAADGGVVPRPHEAPDSKIMQLVPDSPHTADSAAGDNPEPPTTPPRPRPPLKRVK
jgi:stringent starvation protein B